MVDSGSQLREIRLYEVPEPTSHYTGVQSRVPPLNKYINDSGQPDRYRVDPKSGSKLIQEINPATGQIIPEYSVSEFPELARGVGLVGVLVNFRA